MTLNELGTKILDCHEKSICLNENILPNLLLEDWMVPAMSYILLRISEFL
jgi:hypothetical protein